jgi:hypothetical protein
MLIVEIHAQTAATHRAVPIGAGGSAPDVRQGALGGRRARLDVVTSGSGSGRATPPVQRTPGRVDTKDFASCLSLVRNYAGLRFRRRWLRSGPLFAAIFAEVGCDGLWSYPTVIPAPERHLCVSASSYPSLEGRSLASFVPRSSTRSCLCAQGETVVNPHNPLFPRSEPFSSWKGASCQPLSIFEQFFKNCLCSLLRRLRRLLGALPDILRQ